MASVLLDTSFLITLVDATRQNHEVAKQYYKLMLDASHQMYLSSIVVAEFEVKQPITDLPMKNFRKIPFNIPHGIECARLWNGLNRDVGDSRSVARDDVKLIAQASKEAIEYVMTDDASTLYKYCDRLKSNGFTQVSGIKLGDGYDSSIFTIGGQRGLL